MPPFTPRPGLGPFTFTANATDSAAGTGTAAAGGGSAGADRGSNARSHIMMMPSGLRERRPGQIAAWHFNRPDRAASIRAKGRRTLKRHRERAEDKAGIEVKSVACSHGYNLQPDDDGGHRRQLDVAASALSYQALHIPQQ